MLVRLTQDELRQGLSRARLTSPHAFIRGINVEYDLSAHIAQLIRALPEQDDLRIAHGDGNSVRWVFMERLPWDSTFFSRGIARLNAVVDPTGPVGLRADTRPEVDAIKQALALASSRNVDYVFAPAEPTNLPYVRALSAAGFELIETRCHYHMRLEQRPGERYATRLATVDDIPSLATAARMMVNPFDRFHADVEIRPEDADRMMEKWVLASIAEGFADATIVPAVDAPEAFCTAKYHRAHWEGWRMKLAQPVFSAVSPRHKGWYLKIISELNEHLREIGAEHSFLITQITNNAVIRCWEKLGYQFGKGEYVFRKAL
jgi:dTDP-4-amino-4,6-dideoxy-D-galactose acyltransferase